MRNVAFQPTKTHGIAALGVAVACAVCWLLGVGPLVDAYRSVSQERARLAEAEAARDAAAMTLSTLERQEAELAEQVAGLAYEPRLLGELNDYLASVVASASGAGLVVDVVEPGHAVPGADADEVPIALVGRGTTGALAKWLHDWNSASPDSEVRGLRLNTASSTGEGGEVYTLRFEIDLVWMVAPSETDIAATGGPTP